MNSIRLGQIYAVLAFLFWGGISPIYFKELSSVEPFEILMYRVFFSIITLLPLFFIKDELVSLFRVIKDFRKLKYLFFSTLVVSTNWLIFIWAVTNEKILEASLGYYINPLVNVLLGFVFFSERMSRNQYFAIGIAVCAVLYQIISLGYVPIVSLSLAISFGIYGMIRKKVNISSISGLFVEVLLILPFSLIYFYYLDSTRGIAFFSVDDGYIMFLITLSGLVTVIPLLLFNGAATRLRLATVGFFQYIGPSVAFLVAVFIYNEEFNFDKLVTFILIWIALIFFSLDSIKGFYKKG